MDLDFWTKEMDRTSLEKADNSEPVQLNWFSFEYLLQPNRNNVRDGLNMNSDVYVVFHEMKLG